MGVQERVSERILEAVFKDEEFTHICKTALYEGSLLSGSLRWYCVETTDA
jgi:hypothetical protein